MANENRLNLALHYGKLGLKIHPLAWITDDGQCSCGSDHGGDTRKYGKHPLLKNWQNKASSDIKTIWTWWARYPRANIGLLTGKVNGFIALDLDSYKNGYEAPQDILETVSVATGSGGRQLYYQYPKGSVVGSRNDVTGKGKGVDVKADGGYVVAPGSVTYGGPYKWSSPIRPSSDEFHEILTACPPWIIDLFRGRSKPAAAVKSARTGNSTDIEKALQCLKRLSRGRADDYDSWLHVGMALHTVGVPLDDWLQWSKYSDKFDENVCRAKWKSFVTERDTKYGLNALVDWAVQDSDMGRAELLSIIGSRPWPDLIRLEDAAVPQFPIESLPRVLRNHVESVAENTEVAVDMPAMMGLATVAAASARRFVVCPRPGWEEPTNIYVLTVSPPGTRKSAVHAAMSRPLVEYEAKIIEASRDAVTKNKSRRRALEHQQKTLEGKEDSQAKLNKVNEQLANFRDLHEPTVMTTNPTPEIMTIRMKQNFGRLALFSAEGNAFNTMAGLYTGGQPHLDVYLQAHSGDHLATDRVGRERVIVNKPALTICICVQPDIFSSMRHKEVIAGSGLLARFLYTIPAKRPGAKQDVPPVCDAAYQAYGGALLKLLHTQPSKPFELVMDADGAALFFKFRSEVADRLNEGDLSGIAEWASKLAGHVARIAGLLHLTKNTDAPEYGRVIDGDTISNAIDIGRYLIAHAKRAFACLNTDPAVKVVTRAVAWIKRHRRTEFTKRELYQGLKGKTGAVATVKDLKEPLELMVEHCCIRPKVPGHSGKKGGPASESYEVHPDLFDNNNGFGGFGG